MGLTIFCEQFSVTCLSSTNQISNNWFNRANIRMINFGTIATIYVILCAVFVIYRLFKELEDNDGCGYFLGTLFGSVILFSILSVGGWLILLYLSTFF